MGWIRSSLLSVASFRPIVRSSATWPIARQSANCSSVVIRIRGRLNRSCGSPAARRMAGTLTPNSSVITKLAEHTAEERERPLMRFQERLLCRMQKRTMKSGSAGHAAHGKDLQLRSLTRQICIGFIPIDLRLQAPRVTLRHKCLVNDQAKRALSFLDIKPDRAFAHLVFG